MRDRSLEDEATRRLQAAGHPCRVARSGRECGVFASRKISAGELIASERPLALTVSREARHHTCAHCLKDSRRSSGTSRWPLRCDGCGLLGFCSERCAAAVEARGHRACECAALVAAASREDIDDETFDQVTQVIRILSDRHAGRSTDVGLAGTLDYSAYASRLVGHPPTTHAGRESIRVIVRAALRALPEPARVPHAALLDALTRQSCNLYGVTGPASEEVAAASFVGIFHLFNHSCAPNVAFDSATPVAPPTDAGDAASFGLFALRDVSEGEELCISYTSCADGPSQRREHLYEWYGFECACARCECSDVERELEIGEELDALRCVAAGCGSGLGVRDDVAGTGICLRCMHCAALW